MRAAFYECDVTPPLGGFLFGRGQFAEDVYDRLYAKAVVMEADGEIAAIVAIDTLVIPSGMHEAVTKRVYEYTGIEAFRICIVSNHTHTGAPVKDGLNTDATYRDVFFRRAADAIILASKRLRDVSVKFGKTQVNGISFNRNYVFEDGTMRTNARMEDGIVGTLAGIDPDLSVLTFEQDGKPIGSVINFACHQACLGARYGYSGDYSSIMSEELKRVYGQDYVSLFVIGTCGDINHVNNDRNVKIPPMWYREMGKILANGVTQAIGTSIDAGDSVQVIKESIRIEKRLSDEAYVKRELKRLSEIDAWGMIRINGLVYYNAENKEKFCDLFIQGIRIGDNTCLYALPGEIFVNTGLEIKAGSPFQNNIVMENSNIYCGYVPTKEAFAPLSDIYETTLAKQSCLVPEAAELIAEKALELSKRLKEGGNN